MEKKKKERKASLCNVCMCVCVYIASLDHLLVCKSPLLLIAYIHTIYCIYIYWYIPNAKEEPRGRLLLVYFFTAAKLDIYILLYSCLALLLLFFLTIWQVQTLSLGSASRFSYGRPIQLYSQPASPFCSIVEV